MGGGKNPFYVATSSEIGQNFKDETKGGLPSRSDIIKRLDRLKEPEKIYIDNRQFIYTNAIDKEAVACQGEKVLSAHTLPKKFPVDAERIIYPAPKETNPLYATSNSTYGNEAPRSHQVAEAFFPKSNKWSTSYTECAPRSAGLNTAFDKNFFEF